MTLAESLETTRLPRVAGLTGARTAVVTSRPCRAPLHTISDVGLIGGGQIPMPGEVSLAHHGMLLLDERRSSADMSWRCCVSPLRRVSYEYHLQGVINLCDLASLANRLLIESRSARVQ